MRTVRELVEFLTTVRGDLHFFLFKYFLILLLQKYTSLHSTTSWPSLVLTKYPSKCPSGRPLPKPYRVHSHAPSIRSHRGTKVVWPDIHPARPSSRWLKEIHPARPHGWRDKGYTLHARPILLMVPRDTFCSPYCRWWIGNGNILHVYTRLSLVLQGPNSWKHWSLNTVVFSSCFWKEISRVIDWFREIKNAHVYKQTNIWNFDLTSISKYPDLDSSFSTQIRKTYCLWRRHTQHNQARRRLVEYYM